MWLSLMMTRACAVPLAACCGRRGFTRSLYPTAEAFLADTKRPRFDCLVFDIQLDGMSGIELHQQLNLAGSTTPVIYITAHDEPATREEAQAAGCAAYFRKIDSGADVLAAIRRAVGLEDSDSGRKPGGGGVTSN